ncbi:MAG: tRNA lysidine(34) synthetase TilS [Elusimicrobia bacterium]|nr:tRNA lysidine(34) synthetase TilS [Elusimicrobiota bacterium]MDE2237859.1 tRNA lysidine(34) synthetase TilS [Elusimicrobiota bacterium]MDE2426174.1 tRNA lysidine(34) synthetase TilS [Elusimicrobiota bacterium]
MHRQAFAARVWAKLIAHERRHSLLVGGQGVAAAVSGGPDSVCLAHYLAQRARALRLRVVVVHVHHGLRGREADRDAAFVARLAAGLGLEFSLLRRNVKGRAAHRRRGLEEAARAARYQALAGEARRLGCASVATGHQLDDQAETVLLNLLRGTRLAALGAMPPRRSLAAGVALIRPLLPLSREEVTQYLRRHKLSSRLDRSNLSLDFTRNWLRRRVLPLLSERQPRVREHLAGIAEQARSLKPRL